MTLPEITEKTRQKTSPGPLYDVIIHNDDTTPMDFVINILQSIFQLSGLQAVQVMYSAHHHGSAYVQTLPKAEAVQRVGLAHMSARLNKHPLTFTIQPQGGAKK